MSPPTLPPPLPPKFMSQYMTQCFLFTGCFYRTRATKRNDKARGLRWNLSLVTRKLFLGLVTSKIFFFCSWEVFLLEMINVKNKTARIKTVSHQGDTNIQQASVRMFQVKYIL